MQNSNGLCEAVGTM